MHVSNSIAMSALRSAAADNGLNEEEVEENGAALRRTLRCIIARGATCRISMSFALLLSRVLRKTIPIS